MRNISLDDYFKAKFDQYKLWHTFMKLVRFLYTYHFSSITSLTRHSQIFCESYPDMYNNEERTIFNIIYS